MASAQRATRDLPKLSTALAPVKFANAAPSPLRAGQRALCARRTPSTTGSAPAAACHAKHQRKARAALKTCPHARLMLWPSRVFFSLQAMSQNSRLMLAFTKRGWLTLELEATWMLLRCSLGAALLAAREGCSLRALARCKSNSESQFRVTTCSKLKYQCRAWERGQSRKD